jgi:hypothetical protein
MNHACGGINAAMGMSAPCQLVVISTKRGGVGSLVVSLTDIPGLHCLIRVPQPPCTEIVELI